MREVDPKKTSNYITKATNSLEMAKIALQKEAFDNAVMSAVHSSINALDALTTYFLGKRASGSHTDALLLKGNILCSGTK